MTKTLLETVELGVDMCPHSLQELADDIQGLANQYGDADIVIENGHVQIYGRGKPRAIVLDSDEVLLDWPRGFVDYVNQELDLNVEYGPYYQCIENLFNVDKGALEQQMRDFNISPEFANLQTIPGAQTLIRHIKAHNLNYPTDKVQVFIVTKCGTDLRTQLLREHNLRKQFGDDFEYEIIYLDVRDSKEQALKDIQATHDIVAFIDDYTSNCDIGHNLGIKTFAIKSYHNEHLIEKKPHLHWLNSMISSTTAIMPLIA